MRAESAGRLRVLLQEGCAKKQFTKEALNHNPLLLSQMHTQPAIWLSPQGAMSCLGWRFLGPPCLHRQQQRDLILIWTLFKFQWLPYLGLHIPTKGTEGLTDRLYWHFPCFLFFFFFMSAYRFTPRHSVCIHICMCTALCYMRMFQSKIDPILAVDP